MSYRSLSWQPATIVLHTRYACFVAMAASYVALLDQTAFLAASWLIALSDGLQVITGDQCGVLAVHAAEDGGLLATKSVSTKPVIAVQQCGHTDMYVVATSHGVAFWRLQRDLAYEVVCCSHTGPVVSIYACTGGLVCATYTCKPMIAS
jgi:hypothetical protein